tara:strand:+ start:3163 stop:3405 length:243 start_codon:yes stop_codon:yes gene_type:complete
MHKESAKITLIDLSANFSPDGKRIVTASRGKAARIWDAAPWKMEDYPGDDSMPFMQHYSLWSIEQNKKKRQLREKALAKP